jgi:hypothetical protein
VTASLIGVAVSYSSAWAVGPDTTYLVLAPEGNSNAHAAARVAAAGGTVVADYSQIGVLVVHSTNPAFADTAAGAGVEAVASTTGLGSPLDDDGTVEEVSSGRGGSDRQPDRGAAVGPAVGHAADRSAAGPRRHHR